MKKDIINSSQFKTLNEKDKKMYIPIYNWAGKIAGYKLLKIRNR